MPIDHDALLNSYHVAHNIIILSTLLLYFIHSNLILLQNNLLCNNSLGTTQHLRSCWETLSRSTSLRWCWSGSTVGIGCLYGPIDAKGK